MEGTQSECACGIRAALAALHAEHLRLIDRAGRVRWSSRTAQENARRWHAYPPTHQIIMETDVLQPALAAVVAGVPCELEVPVHAWHRQACPQRTHWYTVQGEPVEPGQTMLFRVIRVRLACGVVCLPEAVDQANLCRCPFLAPPDDFTI